jgi:hypothetical protein
MSAPVAPTRAARLAPAGKPGRARRAGRSWPTRIGPQNKVALPVRQACRPYRRGERLACARAPEIRIGNRARAPGPGQKRAGVSRKLVTRCWA